MAQDHKTQRGESLYSLYRRGMELLEDGDFEEATVPLKEAARQAPEKSSVREALGRALFRSRHYATSAWAALSPRPGRRGAPAITSPWPRT